MTGRQRDVSQTLAAGRPPRILVENGEHWQCAPIEYVATMEDGTRLRKACLRTCHMDQYPATDR
jgi:hypothetical protein